MPQPTISRVAMSLIAARYSQPSPVGMYEMSASQTVSGWSAANFRSSRFGATGWSWRLSVVRGTRRRRRATARPPSHEPRHPLAADPDALRLQPGVHAQAAPRAPPRGPEGSLRCAGWPRGPPRSPRPPVGRRAGAGPVRGGARRRSRSPRRPRSGTASGPGTSHARRRRSGTSRDGRLPGEKSRGLLGDLVLLLEPLHLPAKPGQLGRLGLLPRQGLGRAGREVLVAPAPELVGVDPELLGDRLQGLAALRQPLDRLTLVLMWTAKESQAGFGFAPAPRGASQANRRFAPGV